MADVLRDSRQALYERYLAVPRHRHAEIVRGTLYVLPRPAPPHANAASVLGFELGGPFQRGRGGPGGWWILDEPEIHFLDREPVVPDLAGWRVEHMPKLPATAFFTTVPDSIGEVLSPSNAAVDRNEKLPLYAEEGVRHGVPWTWIVDPDQRSIECFEAVGGLPRQTQVAQESAPATLPPSTSTSRASSASIPADRPSQGSTPAVLAPRPLGLTGL